MREWYQHTPATPSGAATGGLERVTWPDILARWRYVELDLQDRGIDAESGILHDRSWRWLQLRVIDLVTLPGTRLHTSLTGPTKRTVP